LETGQYRLLLEYIGYDSYELDKPSALDVMESVGREALVEAFRGLGFSAVGLDLEGLISGKLNRDLATTSVH
jgi:PP-loop superfamily ATP-utilizing enzyme